MIWPYLMGLVVLVAWAVRLEGLAKRHAELLSPERIEFAAARNAEVEGQVRALKDHLNNIGKKLVKHEADDKEEHRRIYEAIRESEK